MHAIKINFCQLLIGYTYQFYNTLLVIHYQRTNIILTYFHIYVPYIKIICLEIASKVIICMVLLQRYAGSFVKHFTDTVHPELKFI